MPTTEVRMIASVMSAVERGLSGPEVARKARAHSAEPGVSRKTSAICSLAWPSVSSPGAARSSSQRRIPAASARWRPSLAIGRAALAARTAIRMPIRESVPTRPITDGMSSTSSLRAVSELQSLTILASEASAGWVHAGWSLHRSPASHDAYSMKHAPLLGFRCLPRESTGMSSGESFFDRDIRGASRH
jgi:hypothetical protein